jgi:drug/metabolite transporter (DMT)-like permease
MTTSANLSLGYVAVYVALAGIASFIEKPAGRGFGALQLNALIRAGSLAAAAVALAFARGLVFPAAGYLLAGLGIGLLTGTGSILYCFSLNYLPVSLVVTLSNLYIVITILLGIVVLYEPITVLKIAGLTCTVAGVLVLGQSPARYATHPEAGSASTSNTAHPKASSAGTPLQSRGLAIMGIYVVLIGVGTFLEKPALKGLAATQLNALMGIAMMAVAGIALAVKGPRLPMSKRTLGGLGVGVMIGTASVFYFLGLRGLPVSVASATSNASVIVTVVLSAIFLHQPLGRARGAAIALTLLGATLLALSTG